MIKRKIVTTLLITALTLLMVIVLLVTSCLVMMKYRFGISVIDCGGYYYKPVERTPFAFF